MRLLACANKKGAAQVMEYCHVHTAPHIVTMEKGMDLKTWDDKFVKLDPGTLCELASVRRPPPTHTHTAISVAILTPCG